MVGINLITARDNTAIDLLAKSPEIEQSFQDFPIQQGNDPKNDPVKFGKVFSGLLSANTKITATAEKLADDGQVFATTVAEQESQELKEQDLNPAMIVASLFMQSNSAIITDDLEVNQGEELTNVIAQEENGASRQVAAITVIDAMPLAANIDGQITNDLATSLASEENIATKINSTLKQDFEQGTASLATVNNLQILPSLPEAMALMNSNSQGIEVLQSSQLTNQEALVASNEPFAAETVAPWQAANNLQSSFTAEELAQQEQESVKLAAKELNSREAKVINQDSDELPINKAPELREQILAEKTAAKIASAQSKAQVKAKTSLINKPIIAVNNLELTNIALDKETLQSTELGAFSAINGIAMLASEQVAIHPGILTAETLEPPSYNLTDLYQGLKLDSPGWEQDLGQRILWMRHGGIDRVSINIEPAELGPLAIQLNVMDNKANLIFNSHNPEIKSILANATSELQHMFQEQGFGLAEVQVNISSQQFANSQHHNKPYQAHEVTAIKEPSLVNGLDSHSAINRHNYIRPMALIDYYA